MGDVRLSSRETAELLTKLDTGLRSAMDAKAQLIAAMAARRTPRPAAKPRTRGARSRPKRPAQP